MLNQDDITRARDLICMDIASAERKYKHAVERGDTGAVRRLGAQVADYYKVLACIEYCDERRSTR